MSDHWSSRLAELPWLPACRYPELPPGDEVALDVRRHPITLATPLARTVLGLLVLTINAATAQLTLLFAVTVVLWARSRVHAGWRLSLLIAALTSLLLLIVPRGGAGALAVIGLLLWLAEDVADWYVDRMVVTHKRVYRLYGVFTRHSPSIALTSVAFIDPLQSLLGRVFGYGTILLDSAAQRDEPLSRFDHLPEADYVHVRILELRAAAIPKFPHVPGPPA